MIERERERLIDSLLGFEHQAGIAIRDARKVRKALEAGKDEKAERECSGLETSTACEFFSKRKGDKK